MSHISVNKNPADTSPSSRDAPVGSFHYEIRRATHPLVPFITRYNLIGRAQSFEQ